MPQLHVLLVDLVDTKVVVKAFSRYGSGGGGGNGDTGGYSWHGGGGSYSWNAVSNFGNAATSGGSGGQGLIVLYYLV